MFDGLGNRFIFPAPEPSYGPNSYKRHLCWIPWNKVISPERISDERVSGGIPCLWFPAPKAATVILFFHANAEDLGMSFAVLKHMRDQFKVNVLAVEYPGYGLLNGMQPSEQGIYEVALTTFRYLVDEIGVRYSQIILFGRSLGSGPAVYLAAQYPVGGLILVSPFSSIRAAVTSIVGRVLAWTFQERFPNVKIIANVSCSTLFIHGESDCLIPAEHSLRLFKRCRARKLLITPPKMEHNSNLFGDASYLAVPAIHFFGFPGYYTTTPPRLPAALFENPRARTVDKEAPQGSVMKPWLCDCLAKNDAHHLDVNVCRTDNTVEDITIRFAPATTGPTGSSVRPDTSPLAAGSSPPNGDRKPTVDLDIESEDAGSPGGGVAGPAGPSASSAPLKPGPIPTPEPEAPMSPDPPPAPPSQPKPPSMQIGSQDDDEPTLGEGEDDDEDNCAVDIDDATAAAAARAALRAAAAAAQAAQIAEGTSAVTDLRSRLKASSAASAASRTSPRATAARSVSPDSGRRGVASAGPKAASSRAVSQPPQRARGGAAGFRDDDDELDLGGSPPPRRRLSASPARRVPAPSPGANAAAARAPSAGGGEGAEGAEARAASASPQRSPPAPTTTSGATAESSGTSAEELMKEGQDTRLDSI